MPRQGPCARGSDCPDPDNSSGQWQYVPEAFCLANGLTPGCCVNKRSECLRWCGLRAEKQPPGRKAARRDDGGEGGSSTERHVDEVLPAAYRIASIDDIWGSRCVLPAWFALLRNI
jgi:hypothetical protein